MFMARLFSRAALGGGQPKSTAKGADALIQSVGVPTGILRRCEPALSEAKAPLQPKGGSVVFNAGWAG